MKLFSLPVVGAAAATLALLAASPVLADSAQTTTTPHPVINPSIYNIQDTQVTVSWDQPNGLTAVRVQLYQESSKIDTWDTSHAATATWDAATQTATADPATNVKGPSGTVGSLPDASGTTHVITVKGLTPGTSYEVDLDAFYGSLNARWGRTSVLTTQVAGQTGPPGPQGPAGVQAVTVPYNNVSTSGYDPTSLAASAEGTYIAACAHGQVDFSGGYSLSSPALQVLQDKPTWYGITGAKPITTPPSGWEVVVRNTGTTTLTSPVNIWAVCGTLDG